MSEWTLSPVMRPLDATILPGGGRWATQQAALIAALADGNSRLNHAAVCEDVRLLLDALRSLGISVRHDEQQQFIEIQGGGGYWPNDEVELFCGDSAELLYLLTAACTIGRGRYRITADLLNSQSIIRPLVSALMDLGATVGAQGDRDETPLTVLASALNGGEIHLRKQIEPTLPAALLLVGPYAQNDLFLEIPVRYSQSIISDTLPWMERFGVPVIADPAGRFIVAAPQRYQGRELAIEPDGFMVLLLLSAALIARGQVTVKGIGAESPQHALMFLELFERMGAEVMRHADRISTKYPSDVDRPHGIEADVTSLPEIAPLLACLALVCRDTTVIRLESSSRGRQDLAELARVVGRFGAEVELAADRLVIQPPERITPALIDQVDNPYLTAAFALLGLVVDGVTIRSPASIDRAFPSLRALLQEIASSGNQ